MAAFDCSAAIGHGSLLSPQRAKHALGGATGTKNCSVLLQRCHWSWFVLSAPPISKEQVPLDAVRSQLHNGPITIMAAFNFLNCNAANFSGSPSAVKRAKNEPRRNSAHCDSFDRSTAVGQFRLCNVPSFQFVRIVHIAIKLAPLQGLQFWWLVLGTETSRERI